MEYVVHLMPSSDNNTQTQIVKTMFQVYSTTVDVLGVLGLIFLLLYNCRKTKDENEGDRKEVHWSIFNQLLFVSTFIIVFQVSLRILLHFVPYVKNDTSTASAITIAICMCLSWVLYPTVINIVLTFSFLAAFQRFLILFKPNLRVLIVGRPLKFVILAVWISNLHFLYLQLAELPDQDGTSGSSLCNETLLTWVLAYRVVYCFFTYSSIFIYYKIYKLIAEFTPAEEFQKIHLLYQFLPIHLFLMIHTTLDIWCRTANWLNDDCGFQGCYSDWFTFFAFPIIPALVSLSYIASRRNIRMAVIRVIRPVLRVFEESVT